MKKTTQELLALMKNSADYHDYLTQNRDNIGKDHMKIDRALTSLLAEKNAVKSAVIAKSGIENHYAYQIFSGAKTPTRDKVLMLCIGFGLSVEETQRLLKITGYAQLYGKEERDNVILFGLTKQLSIIDINDILYEMNYGMLE